MLSFRYVPASERLINRFANDTESMLRLLGFRYGFWVKKKENISALLNLVILEV